LKVDTSDFSLSGIFPLIEVANVPDIKFTYNYSNVILQVFADHDSSRNPVDVPRDWIWDLPKRTVYFGTSVPSIFKGISIINENRAWSYLLNHEGGPRRFEIDKIKY
jgi:hypothetical protein